LLLGRPLDFPLLPFDHCQRKISGEKSVRLLTEKRYSPYRTSADLRFLRSVQPENPDLAPIVPDPARNELMIDGIAVELIRAGGS